MELTVLDGGQQCHVSQQPMNGCFAKGPRFRVILEASISAGKHILSISFQKPTLIMDCRQVSDIIALHRWDDTTFLGEHRRFCLSPIAHRVYLPFPNLINDLLQHHRFDPFSITTKLTE
jgi:hypothetical protein